MKQSPTLKDLHKQNKIIVIRGKEDVPKYLYPKEEYLQVDMSEGDCVFYQNKKFTSMCRIQGILASSDCPGRGFNDQRVGKGCVFNSD